MRAEQLDVQELLLAIEGQFKMLPRGTTPKNHVRSTGTACHSGTPGPRRTKLHHMYKMEGKIMHTHAVLGQLDVQELLVVDGGGGKVGGDAAHQGGLRGGSGGPAQRTRQSAWRAIAGTCERHTGLRKQLGQWGWEPSRESTGGWNVAA